MKNVKLLKVAVLALVSVTALTAQLAFADADAILHPQPGSCGSMSQNDPNCSAYAKPTPKTEGTPLVRADGQGANCGAMTFNDSSCSVYVKPSPQKAAVALVRFDGQGANCGAMSFNDPSCSMYVGN